MGEWLFGTGSDMESVLKVLLSRRILHIRAKVEAHCVVDKEEMDCAQLGPRRRLVSFRRRAFE